MVELELRFLGECTLSIQGQPVPTLARKELYTLAYLVLRNGRAVSRETLAAHLWPETSEDKARYNLRRALSNLREALGSQRHRLLTPTPGTLQLDLSQGAFCDVLAFDAATTPMERIALYTGPLLPDCYDDWLLPERDRRQTEYQQALEQSKLATKKKRNLPVPLTGLIGRAQSLEAVCGWLGRCRLVTLLGPGGAGKTRLALAAAEAVQEQFQEGAWFVDLAPLTSEGDSGDGVLQATIKALQYSENAVKSVEDLALQLEGRPLLLVLDNCEHVLDEAARLAYTLLTRCPELKILATSRQALGLTGEQVFPIPSLALPPDEDFQHDKDLNALLDFSSVRLFVERATQANLHFKLNRENAPAVGAICRKLDGMPLAIEMAASRVRTHDVSELAAQLAERLDLLAVNNRTVAPRQRTLTAAIEWSYSLLNEAEKTVFRAVSVFYGGWTQEAAEALVSGASQLLPALVEKSLVLYNPSERRYGILQTLQQFGAEQCELLGETPAFKSRHLAYFCRFAEESHPRQTGPDAAAELDRMEREHNNLRVALTFGTSTPDETLHPTTLKLAALLNPYFMVRGSYNEGRQWFEAVLGLSGAQDYSSHRAQCLNMAGVTAALSGDFETAEAYYDHCLALTRSHGDEVNTLSVLMSLANLASERGEGAANLAYQEEALALARKLNVVTPRLLSNLGGCYMAMQQPEKGTPLIDEACLLAHQQSDPGAMQYPLNVQTDMALMQGDLVTASTLAHQLLSISRNQGNNFFTTIGLNYLSMCASRSGKFSEARSYSEESLLLADRIGWEGQRAAVLSALSELDRLEGHYERAAQLWGAVVTLRQKLGAPLSEEWQDLAALRAALGDTAYEHFVTCGTQLSLREAITLATAKNH